jgi:hypothetical protein
MTSFLSLARKRFFAAAIGLAMTGLCIGATAAEPAPMIEELVLKAPAIPSGIDDSLRDIHVLMSKDLDPKDNAAVYLVQALGDNAIDPDLYPETLDILGIQSLSKTAPQFVPLETYAIDKKGGDSPDARRFAGEINQSLIEASERLWKKADAPELVAYLEANDKALDAIVAAVDRPRYFFPMFSVESPPRLMSASLSLERRLPFLSRMLSCRALDRVAGGNFDGAVTDFVACHKMAYLLASGSPFDVSISKAHTADAFASRAEEALIESGTLTGPQAAKLRKALAAIPPLPGAEIASDVGERAILHQEIALLKSDEGSLEGFFEDDEDDKKAGKTIRPSDKQLDSIQWDAAVKRADEVHDGIVKALATRDHVAQAKLFEELDKAFEKWNESSDDETQKIAETIDKDPTAASRWMGETMAMSLRPLYWQRRHTDDRGRVRRNITQVALALIEYQSDQGEFPKTLAELSPTYLESIPLDAHRDEPFFYNRDAKDHVRLVSWGGNRQDDAGKPFNDDQIYELKATK